MQTIRDLTALRRAVAEVRGHGDRVALVPTMGALHAGHMALVDEARRRADTVVASIFVNPMQFGAGEDLARYPRREAEDAAMLEARGCAILWAPDAATMYPQGFATTIAVAGVSEPLEGAARAGHFDGVATVVCKLLNQVAPDVALFGEKDWQQLAVVRRMAADLDLPVEIAGVAIVRDQHGLALSSRNAYLTADELAAARALPRALEEAATAIARGEPAAVVVALAAERLTRGGFATVDYVALADAATLRPVDALDGRPARLLAAARIGKARLIDNIAIEPK
ncbi:pantoate--beta-alanine ligase [Sphingomonas sp.]|uniref:pantoate--beta-alanine ligase n=1 Tax=Sphingomonas sp. TaxID=28214 RepID=UPI003B00BEF5